ncbi:uncharacterized protein GGS22DRAFT_185395 [Annulohypoxylon maeteangense]|uniref:uncharacterized protein n=1 Tax=Annulohypoxylon maeteangense TaxID=1927788 RepID=UPI002008CB01|nr:uncharacterized protein GGS22DRAFT_185395 [Annulohypoxylon maeteangense]KAI0888012.1 hypothetical protein GGS22DRAFT_185395 [Annulohypoxylon maeteangense]
MISTKNIPEGAIDGRQAVASPPVGNVVSRPTPESQSQDPRRYQLDQMKRRYSPIQNTLQNGTTNLFFKLKPSDPDFPFELDHLECELQVPASYPEKPPVLRVKNKDIPRGFAVNIEKGWDKLVRDSHDFTLLALINALDRNLEGFLSERKVETVTMVSFKDTRHLDSLSTALGETSISAAKTPLKPAPAPRKPYVPEESFTEEQIVEARARRAEDTGRLEARMRRVPFYKKSADGVVYTLRLRPTHPAELPSPLKFIQTVQLIVPLLYPLQPPKILINNVSSEDAEPLEEAFTKKAAEQKHFPLTTHLNHFACSMHLIAKECGVGSKSKSTIPHESQSGDGTGKQEKASANVGVGGDEKSHIHVIPRPPEWDIGNAAEGSEDSDSDYWDSDDESDGGAAVDTGSKVQSNSLVFPHGEEHVEKGTAISFPNVELYRVDLLEIADLCLQVKCLRCKMTNAASHLKPHVEQRGSCTKCKASLAYRFRPELVHQNSARAGFIDVAGCTVSDMLPSTLTPTCGHCSQPSHPLLAVQGEQIINICRNCHSRFHFTLPAIKFLAITPGTEPPPPDPHRRRVEHLGLHLGEPLPQRGTCPHYRRSYRWFRFACCGKVHACDRCHDETEDHVYERAEKMVCGWCSREQRFAVEACGFCGRAVVGKRGRGFWEGGKGTRDKGVMSRKDKRKFRRVGGSEGARERWV